MPRPAATTTPSRSTRPRPTSVTASPSGIWPTRGAATISTSDRARISTPMVRMPMSFSNTRSRGRDQRSSRRSSGTARETARCRSERAIERPRSERGSHGADMPAAICAATRARSRPQISGIGGGIGRQLGRPSSTTRSAKARSRRTATISPTVSRSVSWAARTVRISEVRADCVTGLWSSGAGEALPGEIAASSIEGATLAGGVAAALAGVARPPLAHSAARANPRAWEAVARSGWAGPAARGASRRRSGPAAERRRLCMVHRRERRAREGAAVAGLTHGQGGNRRAGAENSSARPGLNAASARRSRRGIPPA